jgi:hypothetical protein
LDETEFAAWYGVAFKSLLASQGARWLEPGAAQEQLRLRESLFASTKTLLAQLRGANVVDLESEKELPGTLFGIAIMGKADIVLKTGANRHAIIDMKNSNWVDGHREMLEKRHRCPADRLCRALQAGRRGRGGSGVLPHSERKAPCQGALDLFSR